MCLKSIIAIFLLSSIWGVSHADEGSFDSNGVRIHYAVAGQGEPLLLIHGLAANIESWSQTGPKKVNFVASLAKSYRVIAVDCRGHGKSDKPHDLAGYGSEMVEDMVRLLDHLKIKKAHVVGYSMGAGITYDLMMTHPDRVLTATLGAGGPYFEPSRKPAVALMEQWAAQLEQGKGQGLFALNDQKAMAAVVRSIVKSIQTTSPDETKMKANRIPVLVVYGSIDIGVEQRRKEYDLLASLLHGDKQVVEGGEHLGTEASPVFLKSLQDFLQKHKSQ